MIDAAFEDKNNKKEELFGLNDEDWNVYLMMVFNYKIFFIF